MQRLVIVLGVLDSADGGLEVAAGRLGADNEADLARGVRRDGRVRVLAGCEEVAGHAAQVLDEREVQPEALALGADVAAGSEGVV